MPRYAQLVMGPAGSGKSTYCSSVVKHGADSRRTIHVVNLDPAAESFDYPVLADIRELISLDDVMEDDGLKFGPNGGLVFCMEYFAQNFDWLEEQLEEVEDDYIIFDCPGQIELYTHLPVFRQLVDQLQKWNFYVCGVFLLDSQFLIDSTKFVSGILTALSTMVNLEVPHVNVMTKVDLLTKKDKKKIDMYMDPDLGHMLDDEFQNNFRTPKYQKLNKAMASLIEDYSLVKFIPLDRSDEESISDLLLQIDNCIQYGEDAEPRMRDFDEGAEDDHPDDGYFDV